jgi:hypothetical protein
LGSVGACRYLSRFRCLAWSSDPSVLPSSKELWVVEPPTTVIENPSVKRVMAYPIELWYFDALCPEGLDPSPPPSDGGDDEDDNARWRWRVRPSSPPPGSGPTRGGASNHGGSRWETAQEQVGPSAQEKSHACSQLLDMGSKEAVQEQDSLGDGCPTFVAAARGPEDVPVPKRWWQ